MLTWVIYVTFTVNGILTKNRFKEVIDFVIDLLWRHSRQHDLPDEHVNTSETVRMCQLLDDVVSELPQSYQRLVSDTLTLRREDIRQALSDRTSSISHATLTDFDWTTKVSNILLNISHVVNFTLMY